MSSRWHWAAPAGVSGPLESGGLCAYTVWGEAIYLNTVVPITVNDNSGTTVDDYVCAGVVSLDE